MKVEMAEVVAAMYEVWTMKATIGGETGTAVVARTAAAGMAAAGMADVTGGRGSAVAETSSVSLAYTEEGVLA